MFFLVFMLRAGVPVPFVFGSIALLVACRFILRPWILFLGKRFGLKPLVIFGTVAVAAQYPLLAEVRGVDRMLLALCIVSAVGDTFYWTCYHAYFASLGDAEERGSQLGAREAAAAIVGMVGPLLGGWALMTVGPRVAFGATAVVQLLAAVPLMSTPQVRIAASTEGTLRTALAGMIVFASDGWIASGYVFVWQIALFISLRESFSAFGGAMALVALGGAVSGLLLGRLIDEGHGRRTGFLALGVFAASALFRAASVHNVALAVIANATGAFVTCLYIPCIMTIVYNEAKRSPCPLRFHIATEGAWDVGCAAGCLCAALLSLGGVALSFGILLSLIGLVPVYVVVRRYDFVRAPGAPTLTAQPANVPQNSGKQKAAAAYR